MTTILLDQAVVALRGASRVKRERWMRRHASLIRRGVFLPPPKMTTTVVICRYPRRKGGGP